MQALHIAGVGYLPGSSGAAGVGHLAPDDPMVQHSSRWLMDNQILADGDWSGEGQGHALPAGGPSSFTTTSIPDIDDSSEVIIALELAEAGGGGGS